MLPPIKVPFRPGGSLGWSNSVAVLNIHNRSCGFDRQEHQRSGGAPRPKRFDRHAAMRKLMALPMTLNHKELENASVASFSGYSAACNSPASLTSRCCLSRQL